MVIPLPAATPTPTIPIELLLIWRVDNYACCLQYFAWIWYYLGDMSNFCYSSQYCLRGTLYVLWNWYRRLQREEGRGGGKLHAQHTTHIIVERRTSNHGRRRRPPAAAANSNISDPTTPTLPTSRSLIDYAIGYKEMRQLSTIEGYLQSYGQARFGG